MQNEFTPRGASPATDPHSHSRWLWLILAACAFVVLIGIFRSPHQRNAPSAAVAHSNAQKSNEAELQSREGSTSGFARSSSNAPTAEEIVATKLSQFGRSRRDIVRAIARRSKKEVPAEIEDFFNAIESGRWEEIQSRWDAMAKRSGQYDHSEHSPELDPYWSAVLDAYGVAEQAHLWPAKQLLDYGNAILDSLRPGMVYVGGTDNGRWIPELLNDTSGGEQHIIITQNALADGRYAEYISTLYSDRFATLTTDESQRAFQDYMTDAQKRLQHDQQFPDEPKQVRPGEDIRMVDGKAQVSGQIAVMDINERLLQTLMQKNPDLSFAIQESFPLKGTYAEAVPLGPLMELRATDAQNSFTQDRAAQSLNYWRSVAEQILSDPETAASDTALKSYSHDTVAAANLLAAHDFTAEAENAYRLAMQLSENPESVGTLADLLARTGRENEAHQLLDSFSHQHPDEMKNLERISSTWRMIAPANPGKL